MFQRVGIGNIALVVTMVRMARQCARWFGVGMGAGSVRVDEAGTLCRVEAELVIIFSRPRSVGRLGRDLTAVVCTGGCVRAWRSRISAEKL